MKRRFISEHLANLFGRVNSGPGGEEHVHPFDYGHLRPGQEGTPTRTYHIPVAVIRLSPTELSEVYAGAHAGERNVVSEALTEAHRLRNKFTTDPVSDFNSYVIRTLKSGNSED
ncbi:MAG: hypothetical protein ABIA93_07750 [Candidatus Woesearchaeota archaeon]